MLVKIIPMIPITIVPIKDVILSIITEDAIFHWDSPAFFRSNTFDASPNNCPGRIIE